MFADAEAVRRPLEGHYSLPLVALSIVIVMIASFAALDLGGRMTAASGRARAAWLCGGAFAMGIGIWSMHYVGMEAFHLPIPVEYAWPTVVISLLAAVLASGVALLIVSRPAMSVRNAVAGSLFMGAGIAGMHYIGMSAMRLAADIVYNPLLVILSIAIAIADSFIALKLGFAFREDIPTWSWRKVWAVLLMGSAIPAMHYVGMAAATFVPTPTVQGSLQHAVRVNALALLGVVVVTMVVLLTAIVTAMRDRALSLHAQELARSRVQLQNIFENMAEGIVVFDRALQIVQTNASAVKLFGATAIRSYEALRREFELSLPDGTVLPTEMLPLQRAIRGDFIDNYRLRFRRKDTGKSISVEVSTRPIFDASGGSSQVMISYRDTTEREQMDEVRSRLAVIVESSEDAIIGVNLDGIITSWNRGAEKLFGYASLETIGQSIRILIPPDRSGEEDDILRRIENGETVTHFETQRLRKSGNSLQVSLTISPIRNAAGAIVGASKIARDITGAKQMQQQLRQSQKMEAMGQLTGGIAHDFNNLLGIIIGNLDLLERALGGQPAPLARVRTAHKAAVRGADLTRRLLAFSRQEDLSPRPTSLADCVRNTAELAARVLGPEITMKMECDSALPPVLVDPTGLENALLNLVVNARDAMPGGGRLTIATRLSNLEPAYPAVRTGDLKAGVYACVSVSDTGTGMSAETLERAFDPFFSTKPAGKGSGLGLTMVYGIAKQSGGIARIYSELGYGTTVSLYLPLAEDAQPVSNAKAPEKQVPWRRAKVLVVDDEEDLLEIAASYLREMGHEAFPAKSAAVALEVAGREPEIALVITDILMPGGMNGVDLAQRLREWNPAIKIVYSSGFPADALTEKNGKLSEGPLLRKPYQRDEFERLLRRVMEEGNQKMAEY